MIIGVRRLAVSSAVEKCALYFYDTSSGKLEVSLATDYFSRCQALAMLCGNAAHFDFGVTLAACPLGYITLLAYM